MDFNLKGKTAIVTGGTRGLGKAISESLASYGVNIVVNYNSRSQTADETVEEIKGKYGVGAISVKANIGNENDVKRLFTEAVNEFGGVDILVNNAGTCPVRLIKDTPLDEWQMTLDINMTGVFLTCRELANLLIAQGKGGRVINIASQAAFNGSSRGKTPYSATKGGVVSFTNSFAKEVAKYDIRVNAIAPGMMYTEMTKEVLDAEMDKYNKAIPIGRIAQVEEVANVVTFLAGDASSYMTGSTVDVSGGITGR